jgi:hypothetical protein
LRQGGLLVPAFDYPKSAKGRLLPAFFVVRILTRAFIAHSTNKSRGTGEVSEHLISPFVVGAGNDAKTREERFND